MMTYRTCAALSAVTALLLLSSFGCGPVQQQPSGDTGTADGGGDGGTTVDCSSTQELSSSIDSDTTIGTDARCFVAESGLTVAEGATLTIEAGTVVEFAENTGLTVKGRLTAEGGADNEIVLTGAREMRGWWNGVSFKSSESSLNILDHVVLEYGGGSDTDGNLNLSTCCGNKTTVTVTNSTLRHSGGYGFAVSGSSSSFSDFSNNTITQNTEGAGLIGASHVDELDAESDYSGNDNDVVRLSGGSEGKEVTWPTVNVPFQVDEAITVSEGGFVTIAEGNTFTFEENVGFKVKGKIAVSGAEDAKVTFTGTSEERGWWGGIEINNTDSSQNVIDHAVVEYGGAEGDANIASATCCGNSNRFSVTNSTLRDSAGYGLAAGSSTTLESFENNTLTSNAQGAADLHTSTVGSLASSNDFTGNPNDFIDIAGQFSAEATWAAFETPYRATEKVTVGGEAALTLEAGTTIDMEEGLKFQVKGTLTAEGTSDSNIRFQGVESEKGHWQSLEFNNTDSSDNVLSNVVVADAGGNADANLVFSTCCGNKTSATLDNVTLQNGASAGIAVGNNTTLRSCSGLEVENCASEASVEGTTMPVSDLVSSTCQ